MAERKTNLPYIINRDNDLYTGSPFSESCDAVRNGGRLWMTLLLLLLAWQVVARPFTMLTPEAERDAGGLVAMLSATLDEGTVVGAAIIFGFSDDKLYLATANHNVRWANRDATDLSVWLNSKSSISLPAVLEPNFDSTLDLAVLRVEGLEAYGIQSEKIPFDRLGNPDDRIRGDYVFPMGNPLGRHWAINFEPDRFTGQEGNRLYFESTFVAPGHSGGALWDEDLRLIGMISRDRPPHGEALSITAVLARVMQWGYPVQLKQHLDGVSFRRVSAGGEHTCAVTQENRAYCFGVNRSGVLGLGIDTDSASPARVVGEHRLRFVDVARDYTCGLDMEDRAWCWGLNAWSVGDGLSARDQRAERVPVPVAETSRFATLSAGKFVTCALTALGKAWCWGGLSHRHRVPHKVAAHLTFRSVHAGEQSACGVTDTDHVYCWSLNYDAYPDSFAIAVALPFLPKFKKISIGWDYMNQGCGLLADGRVLCWGESAYRSLGLAYRHEKVLEIHTRQSFITVTVGEYHACGLTKEGSAWCWGKNEDGQLGDGSTTGRAMPVAVRGGLEFVDLSAGSGQSCGVTKSGVLYCWELVNGRMRAEPMRIPGQDPRGN